jgi:ATP-dependent Clp protease protease subunit
MANFCSAAARPPHHLSRQVHMSGIYNTYIPTVWEQTGLGERQWDLFGRLLRDRIIFMDGEINDQVADVIVAQMLYLESQDPDKDISLYINSPGGSVLAGLAIYDTIKYIRPEVQTICIGQAASMAAVILGAGQPGKRFLLPSSRVLIHQPWGGVQGQAADIKIQAQEILRLKKLLITYLASDTKHGEAEVARDLERDYYMSAPESVEYGIVDRILARGTNEQKK